ncbi:MAG: NAD-dependent DNA ligase LigA [Bacteroidetes bacterium]|nr:NAD-dependent DNA ligase LigA [Bacteroidota bacterium]
MYSPAQEQQLFSAAKEILSHSGAELSAINTLRQILRWADWRYYVQSEPALADQEYDAIFKKLQTLEQSHPELITPDSPTQRVAKALSERFPAVAHLVPMLSLDNTYNAEDLSDWDRKVREGAGDSLVEYCVEPKYDGASVSLIFDQNHLQRGATRGDGIMGEDITQNVRQIRSIPLSAELAACGIKQIEIRGEVVIHKSVFEDFNKQRVAEGLSPLANPRNAASGTLRMLDPNEVSKRKLSAILYHISDVELLPGSDRPRALKKHYDSLQWLAQLGFPTPAKEMKCFTDIAEVISYCSEFESRRDSLPFEVDGLVIKVNDLALQEKLGMTSHHPGWATAYKFSARQATSKLREVQFQVGRTGSITPVGKIDPVSIGGVTVSSLSLFNEDVIREKDLHIGDTVLVERAGDVIPYIVKALSELRTGAEQAIQFPQGCPECGEALERPQDEAVWRCINIDCPAQVVERMIHFCSKDAMDIRGMGEGIVTKFFENGILRTIPDLYQLDWKKVAALDGFKEKSLNNLRTAIENSKTQTLARLIFGLGIRHVGETTAKTLANNITQLRELYDWTEARLLSLEDVGPKVAASITHFFAQPELRHTLDQLEAAGLNLENSARQDAVSGVFSGKSFLFTGTLEQMKRSDAEALVEARGGKILGGVSSKLNYLIVGADAGSKLEKAKKLGTVVILTEAAFLELAGS